MSKRLLLPALILALLPAGLSAQQRFDRFPAEPMLTPAPIAIADTTPGSYWLEGMAIGAVVGVTAGLLFLEPAQSCTLSVPGGQCTTEYAGKIIMSGLLGVAGGALGIIFGDSMAKSE